MKHWLYLGYGALIVALVAVAEYRGWSLQRVNQIKDVPKTVRDNPGSYRSVYASHPHYIGGK